MVTFSSNQYLLIPSTVILCRLSAIPQARNNNIEIHLEDLQIYNTLDESLIVRLQRLTEVQLWSIHMNMMIFCNFSGFLVGYLTHLDKSAKISDATSNIWTELTQITKICPDRISPPLNRPLYV